VLAEHQGVVLMLHANLVHIALTANGQRVGSFRVATYDGRLFEIHAEHYVLALGALENARLLLVSNDVHPGGVGNAHDLVGTHFMDHPVFPVGAITGTDNASVLTDPDAGSWLLQLSEEQQREHGLLNCTMAIGLVPQVEDTRYQLLRDVAWKRLEPHLSERVDGRPVAHGVPSPTPASHYLPAFHFRPEVPPLSASRVMLDRASRDQFGMSRLRLEWRTTPQVIRTVLDTGRLVGRELGRLGLGRLRMDIDALRDMVYSPGFHHMGTTRAHDDQARGVVDRNCRVHDVENLFVSGSSVFPTSGASNPTLTLVALALRLADHLGGPAAGSTA
jgi:choline dehydrogenase-like flavoprotein